MRPWERLDNRARPNAKPSEPSAMIGHMFHAFALDAKLWRSLGARRAGVCQFTLEGARYGEWYVTIDASGARVALGTHPSPSARWSSAADSFTALMCGERVGPERITLSGDLELLELLFKGLRPPARR